MASDGTSVDGIVGRGCLPLLSHIAETAAQPPGGPSSRSTFVLSTLRSRFSGAREASRRWSRLVAPIVQIEAWPMHRRAGCMGSAPPPRAHWRAGGGRGCSGSVGGREVHGAACRCGRSRLRSSAAGPLSVFMPAACGGDVDEAVVRTVVGLDKAVAPSALKNLTVPILFRDGSFPERILPRHAAGSCLKSFDERKSSSGLRRGHESKRRS